MSQRTSARKGLGALKGRVFLSVGRALYLGPADDTTPHAHHAAQVCVALATPFRLRQGEGPWQDYDGALVSPDVNHQLDGGGGDLVLFYVEPRFSDDLDGSESRSEPISPLSAATVLSVRNAAARIANDPFDQSRLPAIFDELMQGAGLVPDPERRWDPRIERALQLLRATPRTRGSMSDLAKTFALSPSRFRHLFRREVGMSAQSYIVWLRINEACAALASGASLSEAAYQADFSDAAHFTRTFRRTFGLARSQVAGQLTMVRDSLREDATLD